MHSRLPLSSSQQASWAIEMPQKSDGFIDGCKIITKATWHVGSPRHSPRSIVPFGLGPPREGCWGTLAVVEGIVELRLVLLITVEAIVEAMEARYGLAQRIWVMNRGMTSEDSLEWLRETGQRYLFGTPKTELQKCARDRRRPGRAGRPRPPRSQAVCRPRPRRDVHPAGAAPVAHSPPARRPAAGAPSRTVVRAEPARGRPLCHGVRP
jgi:hypothetical protein